MRAGVSADAAAAACGRAAERRTSVPWCAALVPRCVTGNTSLEDLCDRDSTAWATCGAMRVLLVLARVCRVYGLRAVHTGAAAYATARRMGCLMTGSARLQHLQPLTQGSRLPAELSVSAHGCSWSPPVAKCLRHIATALAAHKATCGAAQRTACLQAEHECCTTWLFAEWGAF